MKNNIIVHIDPFHIRRNMVDFATGIAQKFNLPLVLYAVQHSPVMSVQAETGGQALAPGSLSPKNWIKDLKAKGNAYCREIKRKYPDTRFEYDLGFLADRLIGKSTNTPADVPEPALIVMTKAHDYSFWNDLTGTSETKIAEGAPCPVLFVPEEATFEGISRVLYLADDKCLKELTYPGYNFLASLAEKFEASIAVALLGNNLELDEDERPEVVMKKLRPNLPFQADQELRFFPDYSAEDILKTAALTHTDIIAFPFRESNLFQRFFENDITRVLLLKTHTPVLVF